MQTISDGMGKSQEEKKKPHPALVPVKRSLPVIILCFGGIPYSGVGGGG